MRGKQYFTAAAAFLFGSCLYGNTPKYDIESAYRYARDRSTDIQVANLRMDIMIDNVNIIEFNYYPDIDLAFAPLSWKEINQTNRSPTHLDTLQPTGSIILKEHLPTNSDLTAKYSNNISTAGKRTEIYSVRFDQELLRYDVIDKQMTLAIQKRELQRIARISVERSFLNNFRNVYYTYLESKEVLDIVRAKFKEEEFLKDQSRRQFQAGIIAEYNLLDYMIDFNDSESERINAEAAYATARNNMFSAMQLNPDPEAEFANVSIDPAASMVWNMDDMFMAAIAQSLDVATFKNAIFTSEVNLKYLFDDYLPSIKAFAGYENQLEDNNYNDKTATSDSYFAGLQLTWSLFADTFTTTYQIKNEKRTERINSLELDERVRAIKTELLNDIINLEKLYGTYLIAFDREALAKRDFDLSNDRMKTGTISAWDMIRTKNRYFGAMRSTVQRKYAFLRQVADMLASYPVDDDFSVKYARLSSREYFIEKSKEANEKLKNSEDPDTCVIEKDQNTLPPRQVKIINFKQST